MKKPTIAVTGQKKILHLTLKKKWFNKTFWGEKPEEYREIKPYWVKRLVNFHFGWDSDGTLKLRNLVTFNHFDVVIAVNGYGSSRPRWERKFLGIEIREGRPEWGAEPGKKYFVIKLGERI